MSSLADFERPSVTGDTVLVRRFAGRAEVLLIRRGREPFKGSWALPGGFLDPYEEPAQAARRELEEETGVVWSGPLELIGVFGKEGRDPRGWTVAVAYLARLDDPEIEVAGGDDADEAMWWPLDALPELAFDHADIMAAAKAALGGTSR